MAGIKGLQGVVRKTVNDELQANIWDPQHMDKIVPSLLFNLQSGEGTERWERVLGLNWLIIDSYGTQTCLPPGMLGGSRGWIHHWAASFTFTNYLKTKGNPSNIICRKLSSNYKQLWLVQPINPTLFMHFNCHSACLFYLCGWESATHCLCTYSQMPTREITWDIVPADNSEPSGKSRSDHVTFLWVSSCIFIWLLGIFYWTILLLMLLGFIKKFQ